MTLKREEPLKRKARANHLRGFEGVGGKLFLSDDSLTFKPHSLNIQTGQETFAIEEISTVITAGSDWFSKRLRVSLKNGACEDFIVNDRKGWARDIERAVREIGGSADSIWIKNEVATRRGAGVFVEKLIKVIVPALLLAAFVSFLLFAFLH